MSDKKVLIVDDDEPVRDMLVNAFNMNGYSAWSADCAENALKILKDEKIQVIFLDNNLPGMDGVDLCKKIRKDFPRVVIYALFGSTSIFEYTDCREFGFDCYYTKPVKLKILYGLFEPYFVTILSFSY